MEAGKIYTAKEILEELIASNKDVKMPEFGEVRVRIAGIRGIVTPEHKIHIQNGTEEIEIVIGADVYTLAVANS
jgi:hypothetical protein